MIEASLPLLFGDEDQDAMATRDPVAPAKRSDEALHKVKSGEILDSKTQLALLRYQLFCAENNE